MGTDIHGWVEIKVDEKWNSAFAADSLPARYEIFALLFGVRYPGFEDIFPPEAAKRGFPSDADIKTTEDYVRWDLDAHSPSWITWNEIEGAWWDEPYEDNRPFVFVRNKKSVRSVALPATHAGYGYPPEDVWTFGRTTVRHVLHRVLRWQKLFDDMEFLARNFGSEHVRLVVWFDN